MFRILLLITMFCPFCAIAQERLSAAQFDRLTSGKTYYYSSGGRPYGAEEYLGNRRVRWSYLDGECMYGRWWDEGDQICFVYEDNPSDPHCWSFNEGNNGIEAMFQNNPTGQTYEVTSRNEPLECVGPKVGV